MALKFLGHFVGDVHQPMHVSFQDDRGGNSVDTTGVCGSNLHSAWDTCLLKKAVGTDAAAAVDAADRRDRRRDHAAWVQSTSGRLGQRIVRDRDRDRHQLLRSWLAAPASTRPATLEFDPGEPEREGHDRRRLRRDEHADHPRPPEAGRACAWRICWTRRWRRNRPAHLSRSDGGQGRHLWQEFVLERLRT